MKEAIIGFISIIFTVLMIGCSTTETLVPQVPELPSDEAMIDMMIDEPQTVKDLMHNMTVLEYLYANQKMNTYILQSYIAECAGDKESMELYQGKIQTIKETYGLE